MRESKVLALVRLAASKLGVVLFRNNLGTGIMPDGTPVKFGVCNPGGSDLVGYYSVVVRPEWVGRRVAVFSAIETKSASGVVSGAQALFLSKVTEAGGIAIVARSADDVHRGASEWIQGRS